MNSGSWILSILMIMAMTTFGQKIKVACIGDSITEGGDLEEHDRYPSQLQALLGDGYEVRNFGKGGRTMLRKGEFSYWQEDVYQQSLEWVPDIVIIKLGTNDSKPQNWIYSDEFENDYRDLVRSYKDLPGSCRIYLCTPVPVYKDSWGITESIVKEEIIPMIIKLAASEKLPVIDLNNALSGKPEVFPDGVHPNGTGAALIAEEVFKKVKAQQ